MNLQLALMGLGLALYAFLAAYSFAKERKWFNVVICSLGVIVGLIHFVVYLFKAIGTHGHNL